LGGGFGLEFEYTTPNWNVLTNQGMDVQTVYSIT